MSKGRWNDVESADHFDAARATSARAVRLVVDIDIDIDIKIAG